MRQSRGLCLILALLLFLCGCGEIEESGQAENMVQVAKAADNEKGSSQEGSSGKAAEDKSGQTEGKSGQGEPGTNGGKAYQAPEFSDASFHEDQAQGDGSVLLDLSSLEQGYVGVAAQSSSRLKFQVISGENKYTYDMMSDGTPSIFPVAWGDGSYTFRVMQNTTENHYAQLYQAEAQVALADEFQPFLRPSDYVDYGQDSECVKKAAELAQKESDALGVVTAIFDYICSNVKYDSEKAQTVQSGYLPDPDETLRTGKGICFDYASLAAAMLRSQGIPTKMVFGYVAPDDIYHAWNMFYTEETGWVAVEYEVKADSWNRLDTTFSSGGTKEEFVGDGSNYTDVHFF